MSSLLRSQRGSIMIEFMFLVPLLVLIWMGIWYAGTLGIDASRAQQEARECAWQFAHDGCLAIPSCFPSGLSELDDSELTQAIQRPRNELVSYIPILDDEYDVLHGHAFSVRTLRDVARPAAFGGDHFVDGAYSTMCQTPTGTWTPDTIFEEVCPEILDGFMTRDWCP